jgi:flagellar hook-associated protein 2
MAITASMGLSSGIDYGTLIQQLLDIQRMPINALEANKTALKKLDTTYGELSSKVAALKSAADALRESNDFNVFSTTTSDSSILTATAAPTASEGTYDIVVSQLAKAHKLASNGVATAETIISGGVGTFEFDVAGGTTQVVNLDATTTLQDLSDAINALSDGVVTASVVNDGDPTNPYRLILTADDTGDVNDISVSVNGTTLEGNGTPGDSLFALGDATLQAAQDAVFTVDTLAISSASNSVTGVVTGVTIDLFSADVGTTVTLNVKSDADAITGRVEALIDAYNAIVTYIKDNNRYDVDTKTAEPLFGDSISRSIRDDIRRVMMQEITGLASSDINRLIHVGVSIGVDGKFSLDTADFKDALSTNFTDVRALFIEDTDNSTEGFASLLYDLAYDIDDFADGRIKGRRDGIADRLDTISDSILHQEVQLEFYEVRIRNQFNALELLLTGVRQQSSYLQGLVSYR